MAKSVSKGSKIRKNMLKKISDAKFGEAPAPTARRPCKRVTQNRRSYHSKTEIRAGKTLKQLTLLAVRSFPEKQATFNQIKAILKRDPPNVVVSNFVLKRVLQDLRKRNFLTYSGAKFHCTGKNLSSSKRKRNLSKRQKKARGKEARNLRKSLVTQADRMTKQRKAVLDRVVMKAMRSLKRHAEKSGGRIGFMFMSIKAQITANTGKTLRNIVIVESLQRLRERGLIVLKKARNYMCRKSKSGRQQKMKSSVKKPKSKMKRLSKKKPKRSKRKSPTKKKSKKKSGASKFKQVVNTVIGRQRTCQPQSDESELNLVDTPIQSPTHSTQQLFISPRLSKLSQRSSTRNLKNSQTNQPTLSQSQAEAMIRDSIVSSIKEMKEQVKDLIKNETYEENFDYYRSTG